MTSSSEDEISMIDNSDSSVEFERASENERCKNVRALVTLQNIEDSNELQITHIRNLFPWYQLRVQYTAQHFEGYVTRRASKCKDSLLINQRKAERHEKTIAEFPNLNWSECSDWNEMLTKIEQSIDQNFEKSESRIAEKLLDKLEANKMSQLLDKLNITETKYQIVKDSKANEAANESTLDEIDIDEEKLAEKYGREINDLQNNLKKSKSKQRQLTDDVQKLNSYIFHGQKQYEKLFQAIKYYQEKSIHYQDHHERIDKEIKTTLETIGALKLMILRFAQERQTWTQLNRRQRYTIVQLKKRMKKKQQTKN